MEFNEDLNVAVFTTKFVVNEGSPITNVFHHDDGYWEFTGDDECVEKDYMLVSLEEIIKLDHSVLEVADLPFGGAAHRERLGDLWNRYLLG